MNCDVNSLHKDDIFALGVGDFYKIPRASGIIVFLTRSEARKGFERERERERATCSLSKFVNGSPKIRDPKVQIKNFPPAYEAHRLSENTISTGGKIGKWTCSFSCDVRGREIGPPRCPGSLKILILFLFCSPSFFSLPPFAPELSRARPRSREMAVIKIDVITRPQWPA